MAQRSKTIEVSAQFAGRVVRAVGVLGAALALPALPLTAVAQSAADGMITIPGNGESAATAAGGGRAGHASFGASTNPALAAAMSSPSQAAQAEAAFQAATRGAQIVIPGNGGAGASAAPAPMQVMSGAVSPTRVVSVAQNGMNAYNPAMAVKVRNTANANPGDAAAGNAGADDPALHPAVAALLAHGSTDSPASPNANRADLARLQQQAATELTRDTAANAPANMNTQRAVATPLAAANSPAGNPAGAAASTATHAATGPTAQPAMQAAPGAEKSAGNGAAGPVGKPALQYATHTAVSIAHTMPALDTIRPVQSVEGAMSPAQRFAAASINNRTADRRSADGAPLNADATVGPTGVENVETTNAGDARPTLGAVRPAQPQITVAASDGQPIGHSVTIAHSDTVIAGATPAGKQDPALIMKAAEDFLRQQANGLPGRVTITVPPVMPRGLAACDNLQTFMAPGAPVWGRTTVGVRCTGEKPWTLYVVARVSVQATYYVAARELMPGDVIQATDLLPRDGDLAVMPRAIVTDPSQAIGAVTQNRITPGLPVRTDLIRSANAIQLGQTVKVVGEGNGFSISVDGSAMNNANPGQQVRVRIDNGQTVMGTVTGRGVVQIPM